MTVKYIWAHLTYKDKEIPHLFRHSLVVRNSTAVTSLIDRFTIHNNNPCNTMHVSIEVIKQWLFGIYCLGENICHGFIMVSDNRAINKDQSSMSYDLIS